MYDGNPVGGVIAIPADVTGIGGGISFGCGSALPAVIGVSYGLPVYLDDIEVSWN